MVERAIYATARENSPEERKVTRVSSSPGSLFHSPIRSPFHLRVISTIREPGTGYTRITIKNWPKPETAHEKSLASRIDLTQTGCRSWPWMLACSAGVFFERAICSRNRHVETSRREEEMGRVKGSGEGAGREKEKNAFPSPPPFPSFALAPTVRVTISTLPNLPLS